LASLTAQPSHLGAQPLSDQPALMNAITPVTRPVPDQPVAQTPASRTSSGDYHVQIGVYTSPSEAERAMAAAQAKAAHVLDGSAPMAMPLTKGERQLYRARFAGFNSQAARSVCNELRRMAVDCFVARAN
jgi:D-alanyl-D-alanine carboxypeptidase